MEAVILAAGIGRRMKPLSYTLPKPLLRLGDRSIIEHIIDWFLKNDIKTIKIILSDFGRLIELYLKDKYSNIEFIYSKPLGTAGQLSVLKDRMKDTFVICYSDVISNFDLKDMITYHKSKKSDLTIATTEISLPIKYGVITNDKEGRLTEWTEKPSLMIRINSGIYVAEPVIFDYLKSDIMQMNELAKLLIASKRNVFVYHMKGEYYDLGNMEEYEKVNKIFEERLGNI
ncbi:MAG: nucleotidyltransferase family protein [Thermoproteota archaeon]|nr:nucleotidyltransferase family protein [Thermoproteota archaeon]